MTSYSTLYLYTSSLHYEESKGHYSRDPKDPSEPREVFMLLMWISVDY